MTLSLCCGGLFELDPNFAMGLMRLGDILNAQDKRRRRVLRIGGRRSNSPQRNIFLNMSG